LTSKVFDSITKNLRSDQVAQAPTGLNGGGSSLIYTITGEDPKVKAPGRGGDVHELRRDEWSGRWERWSDVGECRR
jgi:hypothetical protein